MKGRILHVAAALWLISSSAFSAISSSPVNPNATDAAKKLYTFLYDNYGKKTISGIMTGDNGTAGVLSEQPDVKALLKLDGGVMPALIGFDFLMTTGKSENEGWFQNFSNNCVSMAMEFWGMGGIPAFCWHWKDPSHQIDDYKPDSVAPYWDFTKAFKSGTLEWNTSSDEYKYMMTDIDRVSDQLLKMQKAGVAVLWRPLHEAAGQWFWWSAKTAKQYVALYKLMYDRMVKVNGVNNCIWVWNIERSKELCQKLGDWTSPATLDVENWYPGDEYVDVIGVDIYTRQSNTSGADYFNKIVELTGHNKMISLSETDYIPDINAMVSDKAMWSYWMPWDQSWSKMFEKTSSQVWTSNMSDDRVITLNDMKDWGTYVASSDDPCANANPLFQEAECAEATGTSTVANDALSGGKALCVTDNDGKIDFSFEIPESGLYKVIIGGVDTYGAGKVAAVEVNGSSVDITISETGQIVAGTFKMNKGETTVTVKPGWTWFVIDYATVELDEEALKPVVPSSSLVTPKASAAANELYNFLLDNWGKKTISGFMTGDMSSVTTSSGIKDHPDFKAPFERGGKYTALAGFDFMNATGKTANSNDSWYLNYTNISVALAKDLWKNGGIPAFTWHWRSPLYEVDEFYVKSNDHTNGTEIDFTDAMNSDLTWNTSSALYKNMISDIDKIADYFLELQNEGVACIFRPLHEASGGWFWWGTQGGAAYAQLYRLIFDEMVKVKGVNNLIWVWNPQLATDAEWNPGEAYYDVISIDIYNKAFDYQSNYVAFNNLKELSKKGKLIAFSEGGPVMDVDDCYDNDATWSWWMSWYQSWSGNFADQTTNEQWTKVLNDERTITLDKMPGWKSTTSVSETSNDVLIVNPTKIKDVFSVASEAGDVRVLNVMGEEVYKASTDGILYINASAWANGVYFVLSNGNTVKVIK